MNGKVVFTDHLNTESEYLFSQGGNLASGIYFVNMTSDGKPLSSIRIVKQ